MPVTTTTLEKGTLSFSIEGRILRELGERLVKQPEVALVELIKNAYDADATQCSIQYSEVESITVADNGIGMTLQQFQDGWMRIGTSAKAGTRFSEKFDRAITGEKGIGRFAVRFLGRVLHLESVAFDKKRKRLARLVADFDWPKFDRHEELGQVKVPYRLEAVDASTPTGTTLHITKLRKETVSLNLKRVRTESIGILTPLRSLFRGDRVEADDEEGDPGFSLLIDVDDAPEVDVAAEILDAYVLRARLKLRQSRVNLRIYRAGSSEPYLRVSDRYANQLGSLDADIRFFPRRAGAFAGLPIDGRRAYSWVVANAGVAVFDRKFRVQPYGTEGDDWLQLQADAARNRRDPRSTIAEKHFPMSSAVRASTSENWMLRLPLSAQLIGLVQVEGRRQEDSDDDDVEGLVASADREGFVENAAFGEMRDLVRGAVEAIAYADRKLQQEEDEKARRALLASLRRQTKSAIEDIQENPRISRADKAKIITALAETQQLAEQQERRARDREQQLEVRPLANHVCPRDGCGGRRGGFLCPFTFRTVCTRIDCSIAASGWIPQGAQLSRVERESAPASCCYRSMHWYP